MSIDSLRTSSERDLFVVVPISATAQGSQMRPAVAPADAGVDRPSVALPRAIRTVSRARLLRRIGGVRVDTMQAVEQALSVVLGLD
jgi:mRNA-degrading endonuclease toxin of MazEF toxin-antitoxin module